VRGRISRPLAMLLVFMLCLSQFNGSSVQASTAKIESTAVEVLIDGSHRITVNISLKGNLTNVQVLEAQWARGLNVGAGGEFMPAEEVWFPDGSQMMQLVFVDRDNKYDFDLGYTVHFIVQFPNTLEEYINVETIHIPRITILRNEYNNITGLSEITFTCRNGGYLVNSDMDEYNDTDGLYDGILTGTIASLQEYSFRVSQPDHYLMRVVYTHPTGEYIYNRIIVVDNEAPLAVNVAIDHESMEAGSVLLGQYTYSDEEGDLEGDSLYTWFHYDPDDKVYAQIPDAIGRQYELTGEDHLRYIVFQVELVALTGTREGALVRSLPLFIEFTFPFAEDVDIEGTRDGIPRRGDLLKGTYRYEDPSGRLETESRYSWYYYQEGEHIAITGADAQYYQVGIEDLGRQLAFGVTPVNGAAAGNEVLSNASMPVEDSVPSAADDEAWTDWETTVSGTVQASGVYIGDDLDYRIIVLAEHGAASVDGSGLWTYIPEPGYLGLDQFVVEVTNSYGERAQAIISVHLSYPPSPPVIRGETEFDVFEGGIVEGRCIAESPIGRPLFFTMIDSTQFGKTDLDSSGTWRYTPDIGFTGRDSFVFLVLDDFGQSAMGTVTFSVLPVNKAPTVPRVITPISTDIFIDGNHINTSWEASIDPDGDAVIYSVELWDGDDWILLEDSIDDTFYAFELTNSGIMTQEAQIRVTASDGHFTVSGLSAHFSILNQQISFEYALTADGNGVESGCWVNSDVTLVVTDKSHAITEIFYDVRVKNSQQQWSRISVPWQVVFTKSGTYEVEILAYDGWGNEKVHSVTVKIDKELPPLPVVILVPGLDTIGPVQVTLLFSQDDYLSGIHRIDLNGSMISSGYNDMIRFSISRNGSYSIIVQDQAGNNAELTLVVDNIGEKLPIVDLEYSLNDKRTTLSGKILCSTEPNSLAFSLYSISETHAQQKDWYEIPEEGFIIAKAGVWFIHYWFQSVTGHEVKGYWGPFSVEKQVYFDIRIVRVTESALTIELDTDAVIDFIVISDQHGNRYTYTNGNIEIPNYRAGRYLVEVHDKNGNIWSETLMIRDDSTQQDNTDAGWLNGIVFRAGVSNEGLWGLAVLLLLFIMILYRERQRNRGIIVNFLAETDRGPWSAEYVFHNYSILRDEAYMVDISKEFDDIVVDRIRLVVGKTFHRKTAGKAIRVVYFGSTVLNEIIPYAGKVVWDIPIGTDYNRLRN